MMDKSEQSAVMLQERKSFHKKVEVRRESTMRLIQKISDILDLTCETEIEDDGIIIVTLSYLKGDLNETQQIINRTRINAALNIIEIIQKCTF